MHLSTENKIYFADGGLNRIESMGLNGENRREVLRDEGAHFYAISVFENFIYYTDWNEK